MYDVLALITTVVVAASILPFGWLLWAVIRRWRRGNYHDPDVRRVRLLLLLLWAFLTVGTGWRVIFWGTVYMTGGSPPSSAGAVVPMVLDVASFGLAGVSIWALKPWR